jgi:hypothetical protein
MHSFESPEIEYHRRKLIRREDLSILRKEVLPPFFNGVQAQGHPPAMVVVDFALTKPHEPVILCWYNGVVEEWDMTRTFGLRYQDVEFDMRRYARAIRWVGERLDHLDLASFGAKPVIREDRLAWNHEAFEPVKNIKYVAHVAKAMGIERIGVLCEPGIAYNFPPNVDGIKLSGLFGYRGAIDRDDAFHALAHSLFRRQIRLLPESELFKKVQDVKSLKVPGADYLLADEAHPLVETLAGFIMNLALDDFNQLQLME